MSNYRVKVQNNGLFSYKKTSWVIQKQFQLFGIGLYWFTVKHQDDRIPGEWNLEFPTYQKALDYIKLLQKDLLLKE